MKIVVPIKQVPETKAVKMDEKTGTVIREGVESIINPLDLYAIEAAIQFKEQFGGTTIGLSMGPPKAAIALREGISMGLDSAVLLSDKAFAGSDTWATSLILAEAIKKIGDVDLIICGERATDGDTGQVGPGIAAFLNLPVASYVNQISELSDNRLTLQRLLENGSEMLECKLPAVLTVVKEVSDPRLPTLRGKQRAKKQAIPSWSNDDLEIDQSQIGLKGSPTKVVKIFRPKVTRECKLLFAKDDDQLATSITELTHYLSNLEVI